MKQIGKYLLLTLLACTLAGYTFAQKKTLPFLNNISQYDINTKSKVTNMVVKVYTVKQEGDKIVPNMLVEPPVHIQFDAQGNRISEKVYDTNGRLVSTYSWDYNLNDRTVGQYELDSLGEQVTKKLIKSDAKGLAIEIKNYGYDADTLLADEFFTVGSASKAVNYQRNIYEPKKNIISQKTNRTYDLGKGMTIESVIREVWGGSDYSWLSLYMEELEKAKNKKTRKDVNFDKSRTEYIYKKKRYTGKEFYDKDGKLTQKVDYIYEFDNNNNWIRVTEQINGKPEFIIERELTYAGK